MFRKLPTVLPIAILLGAVSGAPALAQTPSHQLVQPHRHVRVSPYSYGSNAYNSYAVQPGQGNRQSLGKTPAIPWIRDPESSRQPTGPMCPLLEGYPDCH
jgi:hypothetical protein